VLHQVEILLHYVPGSMSCLNLAPVIDY